MSLRWEDQGRDWPSRGFSRFVAAGGLRWHVQVAGNGPVLLLLHGTGASTHSWRDLLPRLAERFTVVAPDLPGHGFSAALPRERTSLPGFAAALSALLAELGLVARYAAGHSAGAAIGAQLALQPKSTLERLAWINPALKPFDALPGLLFAPLARLMATGPLLPRLAAWRAQDPRALRRLIAGTGSTLDERGVSLYQRLVASPDHVAGALSMMAGWDLAPLVEALPRLQQPVLLLVGEQDGTVPPAQAAQIAPRLRHATLQRLPGLGHLAHEEKPEWFAERLGAWFSAPG